MKLLLTVLVVLIGSFFVIAGPFVMAANLKADKSKQDFVALQGQWVLIYCEIDGVIEKDRTAAGLLYEIKENKINFALLDDNHKPIWEFFKVDATTKPKQIDVRENDKEEWSEGIYDLQGDYLKLCWSHGPDRPDEFCGTDERNPGRFVVLKRKKR